MDFVLHYNDKYFNMISNNSASNFSNKYICLTKYNNLAFAVAFTTQTLQSFSLSTVNFVLFEIGSEE
jgi:hypothetical protein